MDFLQRYPNVEIRRSARRKRTVSAERHGSKTIIRAPEKISDTELVNIIEELVTRLDSRAQLAQSDAVLQTRAQTLAQQFLPVDVFSTHPHGVHIRWVSNQTTLWGSCTPAKGHIRINNLLQNVPEYVLDVVLLHELTHLIEPSHNARFYQFLNAHPDFVRASAFLDGMTFSKNVNWDICGQEDQSDGE